MTRPITGGALALLIAFALLTPVSAQDDGQTPRFETMRAHAYALTNADPNETSALLASLFVARGQSVGAGRSQTVRISADRRTQSVVVFAADSVHQHITELLKTLDRKVTGENEKYETRILPLKYRSTAQLHPVVRLHELEVATNQLTNSFVVRGAASEIDRLTGILAALDVDAPAVELECWLLEHDRGTAVAADPELAPIASELEKRQLSGYGISSHVSLTGISGEPFESTQAFQNRRLKALYLSGTVRLGDEGQEANISFSLNISMGLGSGGQSPGEGSFQLENTLKTQPGKLVLVGLAPTGGEDSKPLLMVMRVRR